MLNFLGLGQYVDIRIELEDEEHRKQVEFRTDGQVYPMSVFYDGETVAGKVLIGMKRGSKLEHQGIRIDLRGTIEFFTDRGSRDEFLSLSQDLARPGILSQPVSYPFEFLNVNKPYESYCGTHVRLRYFLRVTIQRRLSDLTKEREILVQALAKPMEPDESIQMEVGIEDSLHIEFEYNKSKYHLKDVIVGKIYFLLVRVKIKNMEIQILKRESLGTGQNTFTDSETIAKYEIMDGAPVRGESIPIRLFLQSYDLSPTMRDVHRKFSVRYFLNLVLLDEEERRYYKQQEILLYRRPDRRRRPVSVRPTEQISFVDGADTDRLNSTQDASDSGDAIRKDGTGSHSTQAFSNSESSGAQKNGTLQADDLNGDTNENGNHSETESSPETARTSRSMHRYEPKKPNPPCSIPDRERPSTCVPHSTFSTDSDVLREDSSQSQTDENSPENESAEVHTTTEAG